MKQPVTATRRLLCILSFLFLLLPVTSAADCDVTLQWDPNNPAPEGYRLYQRTEYQAYDYSDYLDTGQSTSATIVGLEEDTTYYFVVRAYVGSDVSGDSNEVEFNSSGETGGTIPNQDTDPPEQPYTVEPVDNAQDVSLQPVLVSSNFYDVDQSDTHAESWWQIFRVDNDALVLDMTSNTSLTRLTVPASTLEELTTYYWTVRHISQSGGVSLPAETAYFTTGYNDSSSSLTTDPGGGSSGGGGGGGGCFLQTALSTD